MQPQIEIQYWTLDQAIPYAQNSRTHSPEQVDKIAKSITEFGFTSPILVGDDNIIIAGHGRLLAAKQLGLETVPVIVLANLDETQRRALVIADNKLAEGAGWDEDILKMELSALEELDFDLDLLGFDVDEIEDLFADDDQEGLTDEDETPEVPEDPVSKLGDVWVLGNHRLLCGSATEIDQVDKLLNGELVEMTFTDPPYGVNYEGKTKDKLTIKNDNLGDDFYQFLYDACVNMLISTSGAIYIAMSSSELGNLQRAFKEAGGKWSTFIIWAKNTFTLGRSDYQRQYEPILYGWKEGNKHFWCGARDQGDVWNIKKPNKNDLHPTMKPVELVERAIKNSSKPKDLVFDPFGGSGTTLIACEKNNRQARLIELDPKYCDVIVKRWQEFTGNKATLQSTQQTFNEIQQGEHNEQA
jgi:DNA modification methylase